MVVVSYLVHCNTLFQDMTDISTNCDSYFLLQNATKAYYKAVFCVDFGTKCDSYYNMWRFIQNPSVDRFIIIRTVKLEF